MHVYSYRLVLLVVLLYVPEVRAAGQVCLKWFKALHLGLLASAVFCGAHAPVFGTLSNYRFNR